METGAGGKRVVDMENHRRMERGGGAAVMVWGRKRRGIDCKKFKVAHESRSRREVATPHPDVSFTKSGRWDLFSPRWPPLTLWDVGGSFSLPGM